MVLRVFDIMKSTQVLYVEVVALMRQEAWEKPSLLLKLQRGITIYMYVCVMHMNCSRFVHYIFIPRFLIILVVRTSHKDLPAASGRHFE